MKKLEFETSKGKFRVVDGVGEDFAMELTHMVISNEWFINIKNLTEEQAIEIVDKHRFGYKNYTWRDPKLGGQQVSMVISDYHRKAIDSLLSLIDSKGIHLFDNPLQTNKPTEDLAFYDNANDAELIYNQWQENEEKTFYNPYIFKIK